MSETAFDGVNLHSFYDFSTRTELKTTLCNSESDRNEESFRLHQKWSVIIEFSCIVQLWCRYTRLVYGRRHIHHLVLKNRQVDEQDALAGVRIGITDHIGTEL